MLHYITNALMVILQPCYSLTQNWWLSILLFTAVVKVILMPLSLWCQKNSIVMVQLIPEINRIKIKHFGDQEAIGEAQTKLYKEKHYHSLLSLIPLAIQILILFGLVDVVHYITDNGFPGTELLGMLPTEDGGIAWMMPVLAAGSAALMGYAQNRINPLQKEQSTAEKNVTNGISIALSLFLGVFVTAGMCFYWICSNLLSIGVQALCNIIIKPKKHIDYEELAASQAELHALENLGKEKRPWYKRDPLAAREKADYKRFMRVKGKHIVFYSEGSGFYKYFQGAIEYLLSHSTVIIHYVTNDPNDQIFKLAEKEPRIQPYYVGLQRTITLFMKLETMLLVCSTEDLENYYLKRSYVSNNVEYVWMPHHMTSTHMTALEASYDHFDTLLCVGPHQITEVRARESQASLPAKNLIAVGYDLLDREISDYANIKVTNERPVVLIGPSWQDGNILDSCLDPMIGILLEKGYRVIVRPHPEYTKRYKARWEAIKQRWAHVPEADLYFERDFSSNTTIYTSDVLVTDWSTISCEFSFSTLKPCIFIDTPMKVGNPNWEKLGVPSTDITLRNQIGVSCPPETLAGFAEAVQDMIDHPTAWEERIDAVRSGFIFNLGHGGEYAGEYLLSRILEKQDE